MEMKNYPCDHKPKGCTERQATIANCQFAIADLKLANKIGNRKSEMPTPGGNV